MQSWAEPPVWAWHVLRCPVPEEPCSPSVGCMPSWWRRAGSCPFTRDLGLVASTAEGYKQRGPCCLPAALCSTDVSHSLGPRSFNTVFRAISPPARPTYFSNDLHVKKIRAFNRIGTPRHVINKVSGVLLGQQAQQHHFAKWSIFLWAYCTFLESLYKISVEFILHLSNWKKL